MEAVIFSGIQAAGKSTFYKQRFFDTHLRINLDMLRTRNRERLLLQACIEMKQPFVVDNTNPTVVERARYISAAKAAQFRVVGYFFQSNPGESVRRNAERAEKWRVPVAGIYGTAARFEALTFSEGFDALYTVRVSAEGTFIVEEQLRDGV
ncbi:MAG TPA: AAA family ATPase [Chloroflexia bacterium]|nr:AAA family ATPase [Chloroflexia bacterium]